MDALVDFAVTAAAAAPDAGALTWLTSLGAFVPVAGVLLYLYRDVKEDRDRYRDLVFDVLPELRDALRGAAIAQEQMAEMVESRVLSEDELRRLRRLLERLGRARRAAGVKE